MRRTSRFRSPAASSSRRRRSSTSASSSPCSTSSRPIRKSRSTTGSCSCSYNHASENSLKVCPRCFTRFPDGERFCLHDSAILVEEDDIARLGTSIGNYRLDKILGRGGVGTVHSGEHSYTKQPGACEVLHARVS